MKFFLYCSDFLMPIIIFYVIGYGIVSKIKVYDEFVKGAESGFKTVIGLAPTLLGLMIAVGVLRSSGALDLLSKGLQPLGNAIGIPLEVIPVIIVRLFSASAANGLLFDIFKQYGPDSLAGLMGSIMMSCTETVLYTMSVYYVSVKVSKTRYTLSGALTATAAGVIASAVIAHLIQ